MLAFALVLNHQRPAIITTKKLNLLNNKFFKNGKTKLRSLDKKKSSEMKARITKINGKMKISKQTNT